MTARAVLLATSNPHKLEEVRAILAVADIAVVGLDTLGSVPPEPVEDATTFQGNARIKAVAYATATGRRCLADDSGLEVDALDGAPGVHSARYAGVGETRDQRDQANNEKLITAMQKIPEEQRAARFVCCLCVADPNGDVIMECRGTLEGRIGHELRGTNGFGYDPLFVLPDGLTSAELSSKEKNARSHRSEALRVLMQDLPKLMLHSER